MRRGKKLITLLLGLLFIFTIISITQAKSVYVISDTTTTGNPPSIIQAYEIQDSNLVYQTDYETVGKLAVGLAIDTGSEFLFITFEEENEIELVNPKTMQYVDTVTAPGASNLAGIVVDQAKQKVYTVDRKTPDLYVYSWEPWIPRLILDEKVELPGLIDASGTAEGIGGAWGLALDEENERLYVTSNETKVRFYDTNNWFHDPNTDYITVSHYAIGIAVDTNSQYVYTGSAQFGTTTLLSQYDLSADTEATIDIGAEVLGIAVNQQTSLIYLTTYGDPNDTNYQNPPKDRLMVYDSNLQRLWYSGDIGNPAGVAVEGKPPLFDLEKADDVNDGSSVLPGDEITYTIIYGPNGHDHNNIVITDYLPEGVYYNDLSDPNYNSGDHTYKWEIGSLDANDPNDSVTLTVKVNQLAEPLGKITNVCGIESDIAYNIVTEQTDVNSWDPAIIYVDRWATGSNTGMSWHHAYTDLRNALARADAGCGSEIWVAAGTYKPTTDPNWNATFELVDGVPIYGGFAGTETNLTQRNLADPNNKTTLTGDINGNSVFDDLNYVVTAANTTIDGFTITYGFNCGIYSNGADANINNCIIEANGFYGISFTNFSSVNITNSKVQNNGTTGISCSNSNSNIASSLISENGNEESYGGGIYSYNSSPEITNCTFRNNLAKNGGGLYNWWYSDPNVTNCIFTNNSATRGGGIHNEYSSPNVSNCIFSGNTAGENGGGMGNRNSSNPTITNCIFTNNSADNNGGGIFNNSSDPNVTNCIFIGNTAYSYGGGMYNRVDSSPTITNCIFSGNQTTNTNGAGGGIGNYNDSSPTIINCTFSGNSALNSGTGGGLDNYENCSPMVTNCIFWANYADGDGNEIHNYSSNPTISFSDIEDSNGSGGDWDDELGTDIVGNIDEDPCFMDVNTPTGSWTANASYDSSTYQSILTDANASWSVNEFVGKFVDPNTSQYLQFLIVSNDTNTITVWSDVTSIAHINDTYEIFDYHLSPNSPCIDAGDPNFDPDPNETDIDGEDRVIDGDANDTEIVDIGADEYYWSPADFNENEIVNFVDYAMFANAWQTDAPDFSLDDDNDVDMNDLALFVEDWLWIAAWTQPVGSMMMGQSMGRSFGLMEALYQAAPAEQQPTEIKPLDIEYIIKWLDELWLTDEQVRKMISEDEWLKFIESVKNSK